MKKIAFIGAGKMAEAILKELLREGWCDAGEVVVSDADAARRQAIAAAYGVGVAPGNREAAVAAETVLIAVKPRDLAGVLEELGAGVLRGQTVISIVMGKTTGFIEEMLPPGTPVVRVMPNNPAMVGAALSVMSFGSSAGEEAREGAREIFASLGEVCELDEDLQDAAMAISGCGPAYFYLVAEALCDAGVRLGLDHGTALRLAAGTMAGAGAMLRESGRHPAELKDMVASPGGSTIAALEAMEDAGVRSAFHKAVSAAWRRAKEV